MSVSREAFDLSHQACRRNFWASFPRKWTQAWWWKLVFADTWNRVCSKHIDRPDFQYMPHVGDYFRIEFKNGDRSWNEVIWVCKSRQDGAVLAQAINGYNYSNGRRLFSAADVKFHSASAHARAFYAA
jgi:hypothetical protein